MLPLSIFSINLLSGNLLLLSALLIIVAVLVAKLGARVGAPALLLFLGIGILSGQDGMGIRFENLSLAENLGHFAMTVILFYGGLETSFKEVRPVVKQGVLLATLGEFLMVSLTGLALYLFARPFVGGSTSSLLGCLLLATVMSSTDSSSVFSILRNRKLRLREGIGPTLELESVNNDPIAMTLTILLVELFPLVEAGEMGTWALIGRGAGMFVLQIGIGLVIGVGIGYGSAWLLSRLNLPNGSLYSIFIMSLGFFASGLASFCSGNGLLAAYLTAIIIGNRSEVPFKKEILNFMAGMSWLMQLVMFLMLGLLARPSEMSGVFGPAALIALIMIFVTRPLSVFLTLLPFRQMSFRAKAYISWVGLKGAGPILFALYPVVEGMQGASLVFNVVFCVTLISLVVQGMTLTPMSRWLKLAYEEDPEVETFGMDMPEEMGMLRDHVVGEEELTGGGTLRDLHLPHGIRVVMVRRDGKYLVPHGSMVLHKGDHLIIVMGESDD